MKKEVKQEILKDPRFAHVLRDPRFKPLRKEQVKVKIDKRFQSMFHDKKFQIKSKIDERGRPIPLNSTEDLKRFYELSESDSDEESDDDDNDDDHDDSSSESKSEESSRITDNKDDKTEKSKDGKKGEKESKEDKDEEETDSDTDESQGSETENSESDGEVEKKLELRKEEEKYLTPEVKEKLQNLSVDYARGQDLLYSDSSSDEESSEEEDEELAHDWGELDKDAEHTEEATSRLAICNMNWDRAKAVDLMVLFHSFLPAGGLIHSITVYPSEYGMKKMKEEEEMGPSELREIKGEDEEGKISQEAMESLRIYQLNRLKYYYAIAVCDSAETANALYKACDGLEYECSSNKLDLRFVPEDMTFDQEPRETCTSLPDLSTYKPRLFQTKALTHSKAELTWDETDPDRQDAVKLAHSGTIKEDLLKNYLAASSSSEEEEDKSESEENEEENSRNVHNEESEKGTLDKYKALLAEIEHKEKKNDKNKVDLEVTWNLGLEKKANKLVKEKMKSKDTLTPFEQFLKKRKEKRLKKKEERKKKHEDDEEPESGDSAFSDDEIPSDIDLNDPYFKEEMDQFKKKKEKKSKKKTEEKEESEKEDEEEKTKKAQLELLLLDNDEKSDKHFNFKKIEEEGLNSKKKKNKKQKEKQEKKVKNPVDNFQVDVNDERFSAIYSSHHFNIDPADSNFKNTQGTKALIEEKLKRRALEDPLPEETVPKIQKLPDKERKRKAELSVLVKTIKRKTSEAQKKIKR